MAPLIAAALAATVLLTSFLSGIFGMAGGMILLGVLLILLDVAPAMVLFGVTQFASNGWRATLWRSYVQWSIVGQYALGAVPMFGLLKLVSFLPDKAMLYIGLGIMPFLVDRLPPILQPDITRRGAPLSAGRLHAAPASWQALRAMCWTCSSSRASSTARPLSPPRPRRRRSRISCGFSISDRSSRA